jgi:1-acyl-sn-glycerol-3-phosphate acyltransferase
VEARPDQISLPKVHRFFLHSTPTRRSVLWVLGQMFCRVVTTKLYNLKVYGKENLPEEGGVLLASSHQSYLDPVLVGVQIRRPVSYMANAYLFRNAFFGWLIRSLHAFPVEQGKGDRAAVATCIEKLKAGHALCLFPEGHRTPDGTIKPLQGGIALIARRAGVPIVPVVIDGAFETWPKRSKYPLPGHVHIMYGKPFDVTGMDASEIIKTLEERLQAMLIELKGKRRRSGFPTNG